MPDILELFRHSELFSDLGEETVADLAAAAQWQTLSVSTDVFSAGEPCDSFYLLSDGYVSLDHPGSTPRPSVLGPESWFGEDALFDCETRTHTARALSSLSVVRLDAASVRRILLEAASGVDGFLRFGFRLMRWTQATRNGHKQRTETDFLGSRQIPDEALYGIQTERALGNFTFSLEGGKLSDFGHFVRALAQVKKAAALTNRELGFLEDDVTRAVVEAADEIIDGEWLDHFPVDMLQGGAGTSVNMNVNEVIAHRALDFLGLPRQDADKPDKCHPNNHINLNQSTNDVYPTALRMALIYYSRDLAAALGELHQTLEAKSREPAFRNAIKMGRTHLQDAVPMRFGDELAAYAAMVASNIARLERESQEFVEVNLGGTAIGTGIAADPEYCKQVVDRLAEVSELPLEPAPNLIEATLSSGVYVSFAGTLERIAVDLSKICNDLRLMASGPDCGFDEIELPDAQPGSSIMPGKINPVIPEVVNQRAFQVRGRVTTVNLAADAGQFELNVMKPVIALSLFESLEMLRTSADLLNLHCLAGIQPKRPDEIRRKVSGSQAILTALLPVLGYKLVTKVIREANDTDRNPREIILEKGYLTAEELDKGLSLENMLGHDSD